MNGIRFEYVDGINRKESIKGIIQYLMNKLPPMLVVPLMLAGSWFSIPMLILAVLEFDLNVKTKRKVLYGDKEAKA